MRRPRDAVRDHAKGRVVAAFRSGSGNPVKIAVRYPPPPHGWLVRLLLPWGDWIMMRKQLQNLKRLAEASTI